MGVPERELRALLRELGQRAELGHYAQAVVCDGIGAVQLHRLLERRHGIAVAPQPIGTLALQVRPERGKGAGAHGGHVLDP